MVEVIGIIKNYRLGETTQKPNQYVIVVEGYDKEKANKLVGKKVVWTSQSGKEIIGKLTGMHGSKGALRARFDKGLPGQAIGNTVLIK